MDNIVLETVSMVIKKLIHLVVVLWVVMIVTWVPQISVSSAQATIDPEVEEMVLQIIRQNPEVLIESVENYQQQQRLKQQELRQSFLLELENNPQTIMAKSPTKGSSDNKTILLEFSDFQCPYCGKAHQTVEEFMARHQDEVTLVYKHFPLSSIHPQALAAAKAAWAAEQQGRFWPYYDALFTQQDNLGEELYLEIARDLDVDLERFDYDRQRKAATLAIAEDMELGQQIGIQGTPFFVLNGQFFSGAVPLSTLEEALSK